MLKLINHYYIWILYDAIIQKFYDSFKTTLPIPASDSFKIDGNVTEKVRKRNRLNKAKELSLLKNRKQNRLNSGQTFADMKKITIKDVAKKLNCSSSTVSRAFNDKFDIHPDTKELILKTAKEMGYIPNPIARHLSQKKSYQVGVVVPEFINAFFPLVIKGMQKVLKEAGYQLLIMSSDEQAKEELENVKTLEQNLVDGIMISFAHEAHDISYYQELNARIPIVQFNRVDQKLNTSKVIFDDYTWACKATEHLIAQGYKRIYHLSGPCNLIVSHSRKKGFTDTLRKYGLPYQEHCFEAGIFIEDGARAMQDLIDRQSVPEAIFCFNDPIAIGAMETLRKNHIAVPNEVALTGFTESRIAAHTTPSLTSVEQPAIEIGETTARQLLKEIEAEKRPAPETIILNGKVNVRESSVRTAANK